MSGETEANESGFTVDTLRYYMQRQLDDFKERMQERYETQTKATDAAFVAQQTAMQTAFTGASTAVQAALESAEKAVTKAEVAAEKRFEAVNEFRGQLADQAATFLPRTEADVRLGAMGDKVEELRKQVDLKQGRDSGTQENRNNSRLSMNTVLAAVIAFAAVASVIVALIIHG